MGNSVSTRKPRVKVSREEVAGRIIEAAKALFDENGIEGVSMRAIASRVGIPTMTIYGYFPTKTAIVRGLWSFAFDPLFAEMRHAEDTIDDPVMRLQRVAHIYVDYWIEHPDRYRMVFMIEDRREGADPNWFIDETDVVMNYLRLGPMIAAARGTPDADCTVDAEAMICVLTGVVHMKITVSEYPWSRATDYVDKVLPAFTAPPVGASGNQAGGSNSPGDGAAWVYRVVEPGR